MTKSAGLPLGQCPIPLDQYPHIVLAHGGGGSLMNRLINDMFRSVFSNPILDQGHDSAILPVQSGRIAMTTDSYVIDPLFFPGGNIGELAVYGTVNDLCMSGAVPAYISLGLIIEEGLATETLWRIINAIQAAADKAGVAIVTGDTKVVDRGKGDGIYINTAGVGYIAKNINISPAAICPGDAVIVSGDIGRHGIAVMAKRKGLQLETDLVSDCASLRGPVMALLDAGINVHCMRDLTRGGLGAALIELAGAAKQQIILREQVIPISNPVRSACELLGFDPLFIANEGRFVAFVPENECEKAIAVLKKHNVSAEAVQIGVVTGEKSEQVVVQNAWGGERILQLFSGEQLPRIC